MNKISYLWQYLSKLIVECVPKRYNLRPVIVCLKASLHLSIMLLGHLINEFSLRFSIVPFLSEFSSFFPKWKIFERHSRSRIRFAPGRNCRIWKLFFQHLLVLLVSLLKHFTSHQKSPPMRLSWVPRDRTSWTVRKGLPSPQCTPSRVTDYVVCAVTFTVYIPRAKIAGLISRRLW